MSNSTAPACAYALGQSHRSICHWQIAQTALWLPVFAGGAGEPGRLVQTSLPMPAVPFCFLLDLTRVKFGSACPPWGRCCRISQPVESPQPPFPCGLRLREIGPINLPLAGRSDGPLAPGIQGRCERPGVTGCGATPNACCVLLLFAGFDTRQIRQRPPALRRALQGAPAQACAAEFPTGGIAPTALSLRLRFGKSDRSTCHWQVAQAVLWLPTCKGGAGDPRRPAMAQTAVSPSSARRGAGASYGRTGRPNGG